MLGLYGEEPFGFAQPISYGGDNGAFSTPDEVYLFSMTALVRMN
jgi:hypothetical protein